MAAEESLSKIEPPTLDSYYLTINILRNRAIYFLSIQDYRQSIRYCQNALISSPLDVPEISPELYEHCTLTATPLNNYLALAYVRQAEQLQAQQSSDQSAIQPFLSQAISYFKQAKDGYAQAHRVDPRYTEEALAADCQDFGSHVAHYGKAWLIMGEYLKAIETLSKALAIRTAYGLTGQQCDRLADVHFDLAKAYAGIGDGERAIEHFSAAQEIYATLPAPKIAQATCCAHEKEKIEQARAAEKPPEQSPRPRLF